MKISTMLTMTMSALLMAALVSCETIGGQKAAVAQTPKSAAKTPAKKTAKKAGKTAAKTAAPKGVKTPAKTTVRKAKAPVVKPYDLQITIDRKNGMYKSGEKAKFTIRMLKDGKPMEGQKISYIMAQTKGQKGAINIYTSTLEPKVIEVPVQGPGWYVLAASALSDDGKVFQYDWGKRNQKVAAKVGIVVDAEKFKPGLQEPADFQAFWDKAKADLAKVPMKVTKKKVDVAKKYAGKFVCYDVKVTCISDVPVSGYLTMPAKAKKKSLPAVVSYHGAGVSSSIIRYASNAICFDMNAHGIENGKDAAYYRTLYRTTLAGYNHRNAGDKNNFYFRNMYMRVVRSLDFVKSLPEWDGKNLIVQGFSQGGAQAIVAGALDPQVTIVCAGVPAMCDHGGVLAGRISGWPGLIRMNRNGKPADANVAKVSAYFDGAFFAKRIKADTYFTVGLVDTVCVPPSVFAAYNNVSGKKQIEVFPYGNHGGTRCPAFNKRKADLGIK